MELQPILPIAATSHLSENSRLGLTAKNPALYPGFLLANSSTFLGLPQACFKTASGDTVVLNNPLAFTDPTGQGPEGAAGCLGGPVGCAVGFAAAAIFDDWLFNSIFGGPSFHGTLKPRPAGTGNPQWDGNFGESLGISTKIRMGSWGIAQALGLPDAECEFGACGGGISGFQNGYTYNPKQSPWASPTLWQSLGELLAGIDWSDPNGRLFGTHYCGPGGVAIRPEHWTKPAKPTTSAMTNMASLREITGIQSMPLTERAALFEPVIKPFVMLPPASRVGRPIP
jgi:hypothetical protein